MPYIQCRKRKGWSKVSSDICFQIQCPHLRMTDEKGEETGILLNPKCTYKSESAQVKKVVKRRNKKDVQGT